jgi:hypothetical protein
MGRLAPACIEERRKPLRPGKGNKPDFSVTRLAGNVTRKIFYYQFVAGSVTEVTE